MSATDPLQILEHRSSDRPNFRRWLRQADQAEKLVDSLAGFDSSLTAFVSIPSRANLTDAAGNRTAVRFQGGG